ncbi:MAG: LysR family transcriptional regulator [Alphaproteobacteria bacterium]
MSGEDWNSIRLVLEVARCGSFKRAAEALGVDHVTVSRRLTALEQRAGVALFNRRTTGSTPTEAGRRLINVAEVAAEGVDRFQRTLKGLAAESDPVSIAAPEGVASYLLGPAITGMGDDRQPLHLGRRSQTLPPISLAAPDMSTADIEVLLLAPGEDVPRPPETRVRHVGRMRFVPVAGRRYLNSHEMPRRFSDLKHHRLLNHALYQRDPGLQPWNDVVSTARIGVQLTAQTSSALHHPIVAGAGVCLMPDFSSVIDDQVIALAVNPPVMPTEIWLAAHSDDLRRNSVRMVFDTVAAMFTGSPWFAADR